MIKYLCGIALLVAFYNIVSIPDNATTEYFTVVDMPPCVVLHSGEVRCRALVERTSDQTRHRVTIDTVIMVGDTVSRKCWYRNESDSQSCSPIR